MRERLKEPRKGSEIEPEICAYKESEQILFCDGVLFVERSSELIVMCKLKTFDGGVVKARLNRPTSSSELDPKPGDLTMGRLKRR